MALDILLSNSILIPLNIIVVIFAILGLAYLISFLKKSGGKIKNAMLFIVLSYAVIVIEHFIIAYLKRTNFPLNSWQWMAPFPFYITALLFLFIGAKKLVKAFSV